MSVYSPHKSTNASPSSISGQHGWRSLLLAIHQYHHPCRRCRRHHHHYPHHHHPHRHHHHHHYHHHYHHHQLYYQHLQQTISSPVCRKGRRPDRHQLCRRLRRSGNARPLVRLPVGLLVLRAAVGSGLAPAAPGEAACASRP